MQTRSVCYPYMQTSGLHVLTLVPVPKPEGQVHVWMGGLQGTTQLPMALVIAPDPQITNDESTYIHRWPLLWWWREWHTWLNTHQTALFSIFTQMKSLTSFLYLSFSCSMRGDSRLHSFSCSCQVLHHNDNWPSHALQKIWSSGQERGLELFSRELTWLWAGQTGPTWRQLRQSSPPSLPNNQSCLARRCTQTLATPLSCFDRRSAQGSGRRRCLPTGAILTLPWTLENSRKMKKHKALTAEQKVT